MTDEASLQSSGIVMSSHPDILIGSGNCQTSDCSLILADCSLYQFISTPSIQLQTLEVVVSSHSDAAFLGESASQSVTDGKQQASCPLNEHGSIEQHFVADGGRHQELNQETQHSQAAHVVQQPHAKEAPPAILLKSYRDLQRQMTSLTRLQSLCASHTSCAKLSIHAAFDKLHNALVKYLSFKNCCFLTPNLLAKYDTLTLRIPSRFYDVAYQGGGFPPRCLP